MEPYKPKYVKVKLNKYIIAYDLNKKDEKVYQELDKFLIETYNSKRIQESVWIIEKSKTSSKELFKNLKEHTKKEDKILVAEIDKLESN